MTHFLNSLWVLKIRAITIGTGLVKASANPAIRVREARMYPASGRAGGLYQRGGKAGKA